MRAITNRELREQRGLLVKKMDDLINTKPFNEKEFNRADAEQRALQARIQEIEGYGRPPQAAIGEMDGGYMGVRSEEQPEHRAAFNSFLKNGLGNVSPEHRSVLSEYRDMGTANSGAGIATSGGAIFVPVGFQNSIESAMKYYGPMLNGGRGYPRIMDTATGQILPYPASDDTAINGELMNENQQVSMQDVSLSSVNFGAFKFSSKLVKCSMELVQDSAFDIEAFLIEQFSTRLGRILNTKLTTGVGGGTEPNGILTAVVAGGNIVTAAGAGTNDGTSGANTIGSDDLTNLEHAVDPLYRSNAMFMMHDSTLRSLKKVKDKYGRPLFLEATRDGMPATILGYPFCVNNDLDSLQTQVGSPPVTKKTVIFGDLSKYIVRRVRQLSVLRLNERFADFGQIAWIAFARYSGDSIDIGHRALALLENTY